MSQATLFFLVMALSGLFSLRWALKLAILPNEFSLKVGLAAVLAGLLAVPGIDVGPATSVLLGVLVSLYIFSPALLTALGRQRRYTLAKRLNTILFWSQAGREVGGRLLSQIALQQGDAAVVRALSSEANPLLQAQLYAAEQDWKRLLDLDLPKIGDNSALGRAARIEALLATGSVYQAEAELRDLQSAFERQPGPLHYRSVQLSELRLAAEQGALTDVQTRLASPPEGVPAHRLYALIARAAERSECSETAAEFYRRAYSSAPAGWRPRYAQHLETYGEEPPIITETTSRPAATLSLGVVLIAAYLGQLWLARQYGPNAPFVLGAFLLGAPDVPQTGAPWRYLSYAFLHGNFVHIGFNLWVLFDIGRLYEARRGPGNLLAAFGLGTWLGAYLTLLVQGSQQLTLVGASGGILGIAGALLADTWRSEQAQDKRMTRSLVQWMVLIVVFSLAVPGVSLWGHVGGVLGGLLWGFIRQGLPVSKRVDDLAGLLATGALSYAVFSALRLFLLL